MPTLNLLFKGKIFDNIKFYVLGLNFEGQFSDHIL
jgi:hypothetical protein